MKNRLAGEYGGGSGQSTWREDFQGANPGMGEPSIHSGGWCEDDLPEDSSDDAHGGAGVVGDGGVAAAPEFVMAVKPDSELDSFLLELGLRVEPNICAYLLGNAPLEGVDLDILDIDFSLRQIYSSDARCLAPVSHFRLFEVFAYGWQWIKITDEE